MSYKLTLTAADRKAINFVGDRYAHGTELYQLLWHDSQCDPEDWWEYDGDMVITVPEHIAWEVQRIRAICEGRWDLFDTPLRRKLNEFCDRIV